MTQINDYYHTDQTLIFHYDELNRLLDAQAVGGDGAYPQEFYGYDTLGNLTNKAGMSLLYNAVSPGGCSANTPGTKPHAVRSRDITTYSYDCNGNRTLRFTDSYPYSVTTYTYAAENHLTQVSTSGNVVATFVYDGDGNRVKATQGGVTTLYIGNYAEYRPNTNTLVKYYYAGNQRVAMREGASTLYYFLSDHLGSTSLTLDSTGTGNRVAELRYKPWGEQRYSFGTTPTQRRFTGQLLDSGTGLYFYNARYYDPTIGRFIQADTIVPEPGNPQAFNRYSYVNNNPIRYTDPSGHCQGQTPAEGLPIPQDHEDYDCWQMVRDVQSDFGIRIMNPSHDSWTVASLQLLADGFALFRNAIGSGAYAYYFYGRTDVFITNGTGLGEWLNDAMHLRPSLFSESATQFMGTTVHELAHGLLDRRYGTEKNQSPLIALYRDLFGFEQATVRSWCIGNQCLREQKIWLNPDDGPTMYARGQVRGCRKIRKCNLIFALA